MCVCSVLGFDLGNDLHYQVSLGSVKKFNIPYTLREKGTTLSSKSLFITADADIVVYGVNKEIYSADAFLALPLDVLGKNYYAGISQMVHCITSYVFKYFSHCM